MIKTTNESEGTEVSVDSDGTGGTFDSEEHYREFSPVAPRQDHFHSAISDENVSNKDRHAINMSRITSFKTLVEKFDQMDFSLSPTGQQHMASVCRYCREECGDPIRYTWKGYADWLHRASKDKDEPPSKKQKMR